MDRVDASGIAVPVEHRALGTTVRRDAVAAARAAGDLALRLGRQPTPVVNDVLLFGRGERDRVRRSGCGNRRNAPEDYEEGKNRHR